MRKGNALIPVLAMVFAVLAAGIVLYFGFINPSKNANTNSTVNTNTTVSVNSSANANVTTNTNTNSATSSTADWKTYTNSTLGFSVKYPTDWTVDAKALAIIDTVELYPTAEENNIDGMPHAVLFSRDIDGINTMKDRVQAQAVTSLQVAGVTASQGIGSGAFSSQKFTFIPHDGLDYSIHWATKDELSVYSGILSTFAFIPPAASTDVINSSNKNLHTYTSYKLGVQFKYLSTSSAKFAVKEIDDKIYVYGVNADGSGTPTDGQWVQVFRKDAFRSLTDAITLQLLSTVSSKDCYAEVDPYYSATDGSSAAQINFPHTGGLDDPSWGNRSKCPSDYTVTNGSLYFWTDGVHTTKYVFYSIGQYGIPETSNSNTWTDTLKFID